MTSTAELRLGVPSRTDAPVLPVAHTGGQPLAVLHWRTGAGATSIPVGSASTLVGSDPSADVVIKAPGVAPRHGRLELHGGVWTFAAAGAPWESRIDGAEVRAPTELACGSELVLGEASLVFDPADDWRAIAAERAAVPASFVILPTRERRWWKRGLFLLAVCALIALAVYIFRTI